MKLIKHIIFVDVDEDRKLIINSLNGLMDEIDIPIFETLLKWQKADEIVANNPLESELYNNLETRGYLVESDEEEFSRKNEILDALREHHAKDRMHCKYMTFIMTYDCNFRCDYCFEGDAYVKKEVMTPDLIDAALHLAGDDLESICLFGGEPLLPQTRPALEHLVSKMPKKSYSIITNGYYLEEYLDLLSTIRIEHITVTLDGEEETHNSKRFLENGGFTYQKIMAGISKCLASGIPIRIRVNAANDSLDEGIALQNRLEKHFAEYKDFLAFEMAPMLGYSDTQKAEMISKMFCSSIQYDNEERMRRNRMFSAMSPIINSVTSGVPMRPLYSFCYAHENKITVDPYGNIFTCLVTVGKDELAAGKYYPTVEYKENSIFNRNIDKVPECQKCKYSLLCGGGCPVRLPDYSDYFKPVCASIKSQIHEMLPLLYKAEREYKEQFEMSA